MNFLKKIPPYIHGYNIYQKLQNSFHGIDVLGHSMNNNISGTFLYISSSLHLFHKVFIILIVSEIYYK